MNFAVAYVVAFAFVFLRAACASKKLAKCVCGQSIDSPNFHRIIGGEEVIPVGRYPWVAYIEVANRMRGGGVLISDLYVLTTAHSLVQVAPASLSVYLGMTDRDALDGKKFRAKKIIRHKKYESLGPFDNDIALIRLRKRLDFNVTILPICLPSPGSNFTGLMGVVAGWGRTEHGRLVSHLHEVSIRIMSDRSCKSSKIGTLLTPSMLCAYAFGKDSCMGDSGGPLFYSRANGDHVLIGLVSTGVGCGVTSPGVYTRITDFLDWIKQHTKDARYCRESKRKK